MQTRKNTNRIPITSLERLRRCCRRQRGVPTSGRKTYLSLSYKTEHSICCQCDQPVHAQSKRGSFICKLLTECYDILKGLQGKASYLNEAHGQYFEVYIDTDYVRSVVDRRSTIGCCTFLGENLVTWRSKNQSLVECGGQIQCRSKILRNGLGSL